jgi:hypothetical protein
MKKAKKWKASDLKHALPINPRGESMVEFQDRHGEWHDFHILATPKRVVFGGVCNVGFMESGYIERETHEDLDETLQEMVSDLETYYNDGPGYVSRIVCNQCM